MTANDWPRSIAVTLDYEGGNDDDKRDPGGRTSRGITQREYNMWRRSHASLPGDVWVAPQATIVDIYHTEYWAKVDGDAWPVGVDLCVFDAAVNSGVGRSLTWARSAAKLPSGSFADLSERIGALPQKASYIKAYQAKRSGFLHSLRTWAYFGRGWARRVAGIEAIALRWDMQSSPGSSGWQIATSLGVDAQKAKSASQANVATATGTSSIPLAHATFLSPNSTLEWVVFGCAAALAVLCAAWLLHYWYLNAARAEALITEAKRV